MAEIRVMYDSDSSGLVVGGCCRFSRRDIHLVVA